MKIGIADNQQLKFDQDLHDHWVRKGHEVRYEMGFSEHIAAWCDVYYINYWDHNIHAMYRWYIEHPDWKRPKVAVRAIDWEVWQGLVRDQQIIDWVDIAFCIAPHIERKLRNEAQWKDKLHLVYCGVDTERFTLKQKEWGYNVVIPCNEIDWHLKNVSEGIKIFAMVKKIYPQKPWKLFIRGKWCQGEYFKVLHMDLINKLGLLGDTTIIDTPVPNYNDFLEDMDFCLVPSLKEAFSYVTAECASKGIKPILNHWYGAEELWPREWLYQTPDEAVLMFASHGEHDEYRKWVVENRNVQTMIEKVDLLLGT